MPANRPQKLIIRCVGISDSDTGQRWTHGQPLLPALQQTIQWPPLYLHRHQLQEDGYLYGHGRERRGGTLQTEPDPFAELDPGIFESGESNTERNYAETQTQTEEERDLSSSESDVEMRDSENSDGKQAGSGNLPDPSKVTDHTSNIEHAEPMRISDLSATEIKKR